MRPPRLQRFDYTGFYVYLLTFCTHARLPRFTSSAVVNHPLTLFRQQALRQCFAISAYCFMPDHLHMLVSGRSSRASLIRFVDNAKQQTGYWYRREFGQRLWQDGFYDHLLRDDEDELLFALYVLENPIVAGLVNQLWEYPFAGSDVYTTKQIEEQIRERGWGDVTTRFVVVSRPGRRG